MGLLNSLQGLFRYPGTLRNMNVFTFLAQPPQNGWVLGLSIALAYVFWSLWKAHLNVQYKVFPIKRLPPFQTIAHLVEKIATAIIPTPPPTPKC